MEVCPPRSLALDQEGFPEDVPESTCILCGHCVAVCSCDALAHAEMPEESFLPVAKELPSPALMDGLLMSRRPIREFKDQPVGREVMEALLDVARRAPTAINSQKLHWIVVEGKANVHAVAAGNSERRAIRGSRPGILEAVGGRVRHCSARRSHSGCRLRSGGLLTGGRKIRHSSHLS